MKKSFFGMILFMMLCMLTMQFKTEASVKREDLFDALLREANSSPIEYGVKTSFYTDQPGEKVCGDILRSLGMVSTAKGMNVLRNGNTYCVEFAKDSNFGYVESLKDENHTVVTVQIAEKGSENRLSALRDRLKAAIDKEKPDAKYFQYLKAKVEDSDLLDINQNIIQMLKQKGIQDIETVAINNGYSTVADTGMYEEKIAYNNHYIDFNYALCRYTSGEYLVIGTPEIITTY